jgi:class 3 adenylate cyclase
MKRQVVVTCIIAAIVAALVSMAHAFGWLRFGEAPLAAWAARDGVHELGNPWYVVFVALFSLGSAWVTLSSAKRHRVAWLLLAVTAELIALFWICSLYGILFQPLPSILGAVLGYAGATAWLAWEARPPRPAREPRLVAEQAETPPARVAEAPPAPVKQPAATAVKEPAPVPLPQPAPVRPPQPASLVTAPLSVNPAPIAAPAPIPVKRPSIPRKLAPIEAKPAPAPAPLPAHPPAAPGVDGAPRAFETTVLVCDLPDKYDVADTLEPLAAAEAILKFGERAAELLGKAGGHLHRVDGEGVVAFFGFPESISDHAEKAVRAAFELDRAFAQKPAGNNGENTSSGGVHIGVSSGSLIAGRVRSRQDVFVLGEAVELARRFCLANRFYGSRILIGPRTFEMSDRAVVARPIDFLSGVTTQERHEIYEPLALANDAPPELLARRDSFWNGVVLYREKRWAEAYAAFQEARGAGDIEDAPLNLYLRRLEPLALHYASSERE